VTVRRGSLAENLGSDYCRVSEKAKLARTSSHYLLGSATGAARYLLAEWLVVLDGPTVTLSVQRRSKDDKASVTLRQMAELPLKHLTTH
jgi:hypothetical protein